MKTFRDAIRTKDFVLSAELSLTADSDAASIMERARILGPKVDAIQVTENQYGVIHMSPLAAASILVNEGIDPVMQLSCCNRNRAALIGDLLGAKAVGISSLLLVQGKKMPDSYQPQPQQVTDVGVDELIATARLIAEDSESTSARGYLIGAATRAHAPKPGWAAPRLLSKINAGAQFTQTQICFDMNVMRKFVAHLVSLKLLQRCSVIADVAVLPSAEYARWLRDNLSHVLIPNGIIRRLERAEDPEQEGIAICAELLREIAAIPGVSGANLISMGSPEMTIQVIQESGLQGE
jgi:methylenetetrahydrofolate reductase (NADPH)